MRRKFVTTCPVCDGSMEVSQLTCKDCGSKLEGHFDGCKYCQLPQELFDFLDAFLKCRGVIRDIERELGISYPTVKSRTDKLMAALGYEAKDKSRDEQREDVLLAVRDEGMSIRSAVEALRKI